MTGTQTGSRATGMSSDSSITDTASSAAGSAASTVKETGSELQHMAAEQVGTVAHKAADKADERKAQVVDTARSIQEKARDFAQDLAKDQPQVGNALESVAGSADRVISWVEQTPVEEMLQELQSQARRRPMLFAAGMFGVGFALSRAFKPVTGSATLEGSTSTTRQLPAASAVDGGMH